MEHPGEKNIDPRLLAKIKQSEKDGGVFLQDIPNGHIVEVHTRNSVYVIAVIDKEKGKVAIQGNGKHLQQPTVGYLQGSTFGGSMLKVGWIGIGMHLEVQLARGGFLTTSVMQTVEIKKDAKKAKALTEKALATAPKEVTREEARRAIQKFIEDKFPAVLKPEVAQIIKAFSTNGQIAIVTFLETALWREKFEAAKQFIAKFWQEHWSYQAPEIRGDPLFSPANAHYLERAYRELELPLPSEDPHQKTASPMIIN